MVWSIISVIFTILVFLYILKSRLIIKICMNMPFFDVVADALSSYFGVINNITNQPSDKILSTVVESFLFLIVYTVVNRVLKTIFAIGRHERFSPFEKIFKGFIWWIARNVISIGITIAISGFINQFLYSFIGENLFLKFGINTITIVLFVVIAYFVMKLALTNFMVISLGLIISTLVKLIAIEFFTVYAYVILNHPEVFESVSQLSIMIVGVVACIGAVIGNIFFERKIESEYKK